jgi:predicted Mrr-cat superfamily restriction endonuclease
MVCRKRSAEFRQILIQAYADYRDYPRNAGSAAGNMWRFIHEMKIGDLVVVPHGANFYVARIEGDVQYIDDKVEEDTAFRRPVQWLNGKRPIARDQAPSALYSRMKVRQTSAWATDLLPDIKNV